MGGEASKEETELAGDEVEAAVDVTPVGGTEEATRASDGELAVRSDPDSTREIEGDGHGATLGGNIDSISELEGMSCNSAAAGANQSFDESRDAVNTESDDQLHMNVVSTGQKQHDNDITEPSLSGALRQNLPLASGIVLSGNTDTSGEENKVSGENNKVDSEMENNSKETETNGLAAEGNIHEKEGCENENGQIMEHHETHQKQNEDVIKENQVPNKLVEKTASEGSDEENFFDAAEASHSPSPDVGATVINTGENRTPSTQTNSDIGSRDLHDVMGQNPVNSPNITGSAERGNLQIEQEQDQSEVVEANSQQTCLERVTSPSVSNIDEPQPSDDCAVDSSQADSLPADDPKVTPDDSDKDKTADANGQHATVKVESVSETKHSSESERMNQETHDLNVAAGMQSHTSQNTNADLKALPVQEKEQLPDSIDTVSGQGNSDVTTQLEALIPTDTSATSNPILHSDEPRSDTKSQEEDATRDDTADPCISYSVGGTCVSQISDNPFSNKEIIESRASQQVEGSGDTEASQTVEAFDQDTTSIASTQHTTNINPSTKMAETDNNGDINNTNGESEEIPIPKGSYNMDFLDNLDDPNFNPFKSKSKISSDKTESSKVEGNATVSKEQNECNKSMISDELKQSDSTEHNTESHAESPVTENAEKAPVISPTNDVDQAAMVNRKDLEGNAEVKVDSDVNQDTKDQTISDGNKSKTDTDAPNVSGVDGSGHMPSQTDESTTDEGSDMAVEKSSAVYVKAEHIEPNTSKELEPNTTKELEKDNKTKENKQNNSTENIKKSQLDATDESHETCAVKNSSDAKCEQSVPNVTDELEEKPKESKQNNSTENSEKSLHETDRSTKTVEPNNVVENSFDVKPEQSEPNTIKELETDDKPEENKQNDSNKNIEISQQTPVAKDSSSANGPVETEGKGSYVSEKPKSIDIIDSNDTVRRDSVKQSNKEVLKSREQNDISEHDRTGLPVNDTNSATTEMEIPKSDISSSEVIPSVNGDSDVSSSNIEASCDTKQQDVIEKSTRCSNDKKNDMELKNRGKFEQSEEMPKNVDTAETSHGKTDMKPATEVDDTSEVSKG